MDECVQGSYGYILFHFIEVDPKKRSIWSRFILSEKRFSSNFCYKNGHCPNSMDKFNQLNIFIYTITANISFAVSHCSSEAECLHIRSLLENVPWTCCRSLQEEDEGSADSAESDLELMMSQDFEDANIGSVQKPRKPLRRKGLQGPHQRRRQSGTLATATNRSEPSRPLSIDRDCNRPSSPDLG